MGKTFVTSSVLYVKCKVHDLFQQDKASTELNCEGSPADCRVRFRKEASLEECFECSCSKCLMQNEVGQERVGCSL